MTASMFGYRKPVLSESHRDPLTTLRETLDRLEAEDESPRIEDLKRILAARIHEMEKKTA